MSSNPSTRPDGSPPEAIASRAVQLSVLDLPDPLAQQRTRLGRLKMLLVLIVCAAPVVASYLTFYVIRPEGRTNHGTLIDPPLPLPAPAALPLKDAQGAPVDPASLKGQWLLVTVAGGDCDAACEQRLYLARQIRETLGKEKDKLDRVWLIPDGRPMRENLSAAMKGATVLQADRTALSAWLAPEAGQALENHWYLVDPRGQWMMRFPADAEPRKVMKDLSRLVRAAASWDQPGRP